MPFDIFAPLTLKFYRAAHAWLEPRATSSPGCLLNDSHRLALQRELPSKLSLVELRKETEQNKFARFRLHQRRLLQVEPNHRKHPEVYKLDSPDP